MGKEKIEEKDARLLLVIVLAGGIISAGGEGADALRRRQAGHVR